MTYERHSDARVPTSYRVDGYRLGMWVAMPRNRRSRLDADRKQRLQDLPGWTWKARSNQAQRAGRSQQRTPDLPR